jgi:hypothetical protein
MSTLIHGQFLTTNRSRKTYKRMAIEKLESGKTQEANEYFQKAVNISPRVAHQLIQVRNVPKSLNHTHDENLTKPLGIKKTQCRVYCCSV